MARVKCFRAPQNEASGHALPRPSPLPPLPQPKPRLRPALDAHVERHQRPGHLAGPAAEIDGNGGDEQAIEVRAAERHVARIDHRQIEDAVEARCRHAGELCAANHGRPYRPLGVGRRAIRRAAELGMVQHERRRGDARAGGTIGKAVHFARQRVAEDEPLAAARVQDDRPVGIAERRVKLGPAADSGKVPERARTGREIERAGDEIAGVIGIGVVGARAELLRVGGEQVAGAGIGVDDMQAVGEADDQPVILSEDDAGRPRRQLEGFKRRLGAFEPVQRLGEDVDEIEPLAPVVPAQALTPGEREVAYAVHCSESVRSATSTRCACRR